MRTRTALVAFAGLLAILPGAAQETVLEILTVRNRPADSLVGDLLPLAGPSGAVAAAGNKLIVNATPAALAQIKRVLAEIDVVPRSLWITVRQGGSSRETATVTQVTGRVDSPGGRTRTVVTGAFSRQDAAGADETEQRVRALEGMPALIRVARSMWLPTVVLAPTPQGPVAAEGTSLQEAETGLYVLPRLAGEIVTLELAATKEAFNASGGIDGQRLVTAVNGRLGEWITIGGLSRGGEASAGGARSQSTEERVVRVRVEEIR